MEKTALQKSLETAMKNAEDLRPLIEKGEATPEQKEQFKKYTAEAKSIASDIDASKMLDDVKDWGKKSNGEAVVPATFDRLALTEEGAIKGVTADPKTGELLPIAGFMEEGEANIKALSSGAYKDFFAQKIRNQALHGNEWRHHMKGNAMKILNEGSFTAGEAWIPPDFRANLVQRMATLTSVRPNATVYTTGTDHITFPQAVYTTDDLFTSGLRATWQGSGAQTSSPSESTNPIAGQIRIPVYLETANIICQREQIEDNSFDLLGYLTKLGAEAFALTEEASFTGATVGSTVYGNGVSQPAGLTYHPAVGVSYGSTSTVNGTTYSGIAVNASSASVDLAWGTSAGIVGIRGAETSLAPQYENGAAWYAHKTTYGALRDLNAGTATLPQWSLGESYPNYANGFQATLLGYPTKKNQFLPTASSGVWTGGNVVAFLGNMDAYWIADRVGFSVEVNPWIYQDRDQVLIYMRKRTGGQLVEYWKMRAVTIVA